MSRNGSAVAAALILAALATAGCRAGGLASDAAAPPAMSARQPNIIVIMADDLGYADVSTYPGGRIPTPNIDRLGAGGVIFTAGYVTAPICGPSRASLMTGRYQQRFGFEYNNGPDVRDAREHLGLHGDEVTLADALKTAGYRTGAIGKWHLGSSPEHYPTRRGFDEWWGFLSGQTNYIDPDSPDAINPEQVAGDDRLAAQIGQPYRPLNPLNQVMTGPDRTPVDVSRTYLTEEITRQAIAFIDRNANQPFFLHLGYSAPHTPFQTTAKYYDRFNHISDRRQRIYASMVSALDDGVGAVLDHLEAANLTENTLVIFLSDNGCAAYVPGLCDAARFSGGKLTNLEGGVRVPFMMRWPARIPAGLVHEAPVTSMDVFPTLIAAAGAPLPNRQYDGFDLLPRLAMDEPAERPLFWRSKPIRAVRHGDWKYHEDFDGQRFLYHLRSDPKELVNLVDQEPERAAAMKAELDRWEEDKVAPAWSGRFLSFRFDGRTFKFQP